MANPEIHKTHTFSPDDPMPSTMKPREAEGLVNTPANQGFKGKADLGSKDVVLGSQNYHLNTKVFREKSTRKK